MTCKPCNPNPKPQNRGAFDVILLLIVSLSQHMPNLLTGKRRISNLEPFKSYAFNPNLQTLDKPLKT